MGDRLLRHEDGEGTPTVIAVVMTVKDAVYEERYSQNDSFQDPDPEYPRTMEMPGSDNTSLSLDSDRYTNDSAEYDDYPPSSRRRRDDSRKYDPRNPDMYDHQTYGMSPPPKFRDEEQRRALQRQQRALQQHQNKQRLLQRQQQQQEALMRRRQQQHVEEPDNYREELESMSSSEYSEASCASSGAHPSFLTSSLLAQHTKQMGKPGPVTRNERFAAQRAVQQEREKRREPEPRARPPSPSLSSDRPLTRLEQIQIQQWEQQEAMFKNQGNAMPPFDFEQEPADIPPSSVRRRRSGSSEGSGRRRGPKLPSFFLSPEGSGYSQGHGAPTDEFTPVEMPSFPKAQATNSGQRTVSVADDEDRLDNSAGHDDSINGLSMNFGSLLRPEDLRATEESISLSLDSSGLQQSAMEDSNPGKAGASAAKNRADVSKTAVVQLYQRILELTNKQHELESQPESDPDEKKEVARELEALYEKLNSEVET
ncbi:Hypothetical protein PHPALM_4501 [Phytophthora palmivora]|uniref:Uncharacterized protein n=1 Tax=Phytophthora palmivora TaxID=4796 RepID=A0A2P4YJN6_9STRA|nr:Hypothetical protein PHPALM_4501 [Phytophthora palmivora]